jgi:hydrogenase expression/formation protein HypC
MCLGIPARLIKKEGNLGEVEIGGLIKKVNLTLVPEVKIDEYVIIHAGFAISILNEEEANKTLELLQLL